MKVTVVICQDTPEITWNALRLGNMMLEGMEDVSIFLNGPSVKYEEADSEQFQLKELAKIFTLSEVEPGGADIYKVVGGIRPGAKTNLRHELQGSADPVLPIFDSLLIIFLSQYIANLITIQKEFELTLTYIFFSDYFFQ